MLKNVIKISHTQLSFFIFHITVDPLSLKSCTLHDIMTEDTPSARLGVDAGGQITPTNFSEILEYPYYYF